MAKRKHTLSHAGRTTRIPLKTPPTPPANLHSVSLVPRDTSAARTLPVADLDADRLADILRSSENGSSSALFRLAAAVILQDGHIQAELFKRKLAVLGDALSVQPFDPHDPADVQASDACAALLAQLPELEQALTHLLDGTLFPLAILEKTYAPADPSQPALGRRVALRALTPVPATLLAWDVDGLPTVDPDAERFPRGGFRSDLPPLDPSRFIVHRSHGLTLPDRFGGPLRAVFWLWLLSSMSISWWARCLERYGAPFIVGRYDDSSSDSDRRVLESAISMATQLGGLVISSASSVELAESSKDSGAAFSALRAECRAEISRLILGQTLSAIASPTGLGNGAADLQADVRNDIRRYDSRQLAATVRLQLLAPWLRLNGYPGNPPAVSFADDTSAETARTADVLGKLSAAGLEPTDDALPALSERIGFPIQRRTLPAASPFAGPGGAGTGFFRGRPLDPSLF